MPDVSEDEIVRADSRGRVTLGIVETKKYFRVNRSDDGQITLTPVVHIPEREKWLWNDPVALASVRRGLAEAASGKAEYVGSFAEFLDDDGAAEAGG